MPNIKIIAVNLNLLASYRGYFLTATKVNLETNINQVMQNLLKFF